MVDGAVANAFAAHPDYLTPRGNRQARTAIVKRVVGAIMGYAAERGTGHADEARYGSEFSSAVQDGVGGTLGPDAGGQAAST